MWRRVSAWFQTPQGYLVLALLCAANAAVNWATSSTVLAVMFTALAIVFGVRAWLVWRAMNAAAR